MKKELNEYYMPAEWHLHERTFIEWPQKASMCWPENHEEVNKAYADVINAINRFEKVTVIVGEDTLKEAEKLCDIRVEMVVIPHDDAWIRDNGPTFVIDGKGGIKGINWLFNAWGEKYTPYDLDDAVASELLNRLRIDTIDVPIVLEGGSIHVDGEGTLLSTKECLLNPNRNPDLKREEIEQILREQLGVTTFIWLNRGLDGDETDGHIDNIACFVKPGTVMIQTCYDEKDPNYGITKENMAILKEVKDAKGRALEIIEIPTPPIRYYKGERLTLSYLNYYFVNGAIIVPVFGGDASETDEKAIKILHRTFPEREIIAVDGMGLIKEGGNVHCITQQMPLVEERKN